MFSYLSVLKDKDGCLSSKRVGFLVLLFLTIYVVDKSLTYLILAEKADNITDIVKTLLWVLASIGGAVATERFRK